MSYLVDTNVFCEPVRPKPDAAVVEWLRANESSLFVSTITIGEIRRGNGKPVLPPHDNAFLPDPLGLAWRSERVYA